MPPVPKRSRQNRRVREVATCRLWPLPKASTRPCGEGSGSPSEKREHTRDQEICRAPPLTERVRGLGTTAT